MGQTVLTPNQHRFLELATQEKEITDWYFFTGGTALSAFYLKHRLSEDLDFFSESEIDENKIAEFVATSAKTLKATVAAGTQRASIKVYRLPV